MVLLVGAGLIGILSLALYTGVRHVRFWILRVWIEFKVYIYRVTKATAHSRLVKRKAKRA